MTPVLCLDPVSASAVAAGLTTAVGLGPLVCARVVRRRFVSEAVATFACTWVRFRGGLWRVVLTPEQWATYHRETL